MSSRRNWSPTRRLQFFRDNGGTCHLCGGAIDATAEGWDLSHEIPLELGGADDESNIRIAHRKCHRRHTAEVDVPRIAKAKRQELRDCGIRRSKGRPMPGSRASGWKRGFDGTVTRR